MFELKAISFVAAAGMVVASTSGSTDWYAKLIVDAPVIALLWWAHAKTIPNMSELHRKSIADLTAEIKANGVATNKLLKEALDRSLDDSCDNQPAPRRQD